MRKRGAGAGRWPAAVETNIVDATSETPARNRMSADDTIPFMSHPGGLTRDHVVWAYRLLLDRDPENEDVFAPKLAGSRTTAELRHHLITSAEFRDKNP